MTIINDTRLTDLKTTVREYGRDAASGQDAKPKFALAVCRAAQDDVIGPDDAEMLYTEYSTAQSKKAIHNHTADGMKANVSKLRQVINLGGLANVDGVALLDKVTDIREELRGSDVKIKDAFSAFVDVSRAQLRHPDIELSTDELRQIISKAESAPKDLLAKLAEDYKRLFARANEMSDNGMNCHAVETAMHAVGDAITEAGGELPAVTKEQKQKVAFLRKAQAMGYSVAA